AHGGIVGVYGMDIFKRKRLHLRGALVHRKGLLALDVIGFSVRVAEIEAVDHKRSQHSVHSDILKGYLVHHAVLSPSSSALDAQSPVRLFKTAVLVGKVLYPRSNLRSDYHAAVTVVHGALTYNHILTGGLVGLSHINLSGLDSNAVVSH